MATTDFIRGTRAYGHNTDQSENQKLIPHRYPMLLVDRIIECDDQMRSEVEILNTRGSVIRAHGQMLVDGQLASEAGLLFMLTDQKV